MKTTPKELRALKRAARTAQPAYVRIKALALVNLAGGRGASDTAGMLGVSRQTVSRWKARYLEEGMEGLRVRPGRGRKPVADLEELARYVRQSPRNFGINRTRWTLKGLAEAVPSLDGFTAFGVQQALRRAGLSYKRGQPRLHSPDPLYEEKKGLWRRR